MMGRKHTEETKRRMSESHKGHVPWNKGKKTGPVSEELRKKQSLRMMGEKNHFYGRKHSEESRRKMSEANMGREVWNKGKRCPKISRTLMGHSVSSETREKLRKARLRQADPRLGKRHSEESRKKMCEARLNSDYVFPLKDTSIEIAMQEELGVRGIVFEKHVPLLGRYQVDIKIGDLIIECDGNYWHSFPDGTEKDRRRDAALKEAGYGVLRFWGSEINEDVSRCVDTIEGVLG